VKLAAGRQRGAAAVKLVTGRHGGTAATGVRGPRAGGTQRSECAVYKQGNATVGEPGERGGGGMVTCSRRAARERERAGAHGRRDGEWRGTGKDAYRLFRDAERETECMTLATLLETSFNILCFFYLSMLIYITCWNEML
jgi:hypothetical protein